MSQQIIKRRLSFITDLIIFFILILTTTVIIKISNINQNTEETSSLLLVGSNESVSDENQMYIKKIEKEYGIKVEYGSEVKKFTDKVNASSQEDTYIINNNLKTIYTSLKKYPTNAFKTFEKNKNPIYILIVDKFENDNIALASRNKLNEFRMYISNADNFERAFHHEMFHILEYFMNINNAEMFFDWKNLNPNKFEYNSDTSKLDRLYVYNKDSYDKYNTYFVTKYSKATEKEDRAEIFAELMITNKKLEYLENEDNLRKKVNTIMENINEKITDEEFYCDKYLK